MWCAVECDAHSGRSPEFSPSRGPIRRIRLRKCTYLKIIPVHMMIREIIPGRQQRVRRCPLTVAGILISSVKVLATLTSAKADRCGWVHWLTLNNRRQSIGPKPGSRPRLKGAHYQVPDKLLTPTQPFLTLQSCTHSHTSSTRLLPSWVSAMGLS